MLVSEVVGGVALSKTWLGKKRLHNYSLMPVLVWFNPIPGFSEYLQLVS